MKQIGVKNQIFYFILLTGIHVYVQTIECVHSMGKSLNVYVVLNVDNC